MGVLVGVPLNQINTREIESLLTAMPHMKMLGFMKPSIKN